MDQVTNVKNQFRLEQWTKLIQNCKASCMTINEWCELNNVSPHAYYYWLRKIRMTAAQELPTLQSEQEIHFKRLEVQSPASFSQSAAVVHFQGTTIEVQKGADRQTIEAVLLALKSVC